MSKVGRPTKYKPEYCETVVRLMSQGVSKEEVCYDPEEGIGISYQTFLTWQKEHPEFLEAVKDGERASAAWWQKTGRTAVLGGIDGFNATAYVFNMKNRFGWADKVQQEVSGPNGDPVQTELTIKFVRPE